MDIILVRHAAAADAAPGAGDAGRELTPEGRKAAGDTLPELKKRVNPEANIAIWTSPALRAFQTARIIANGLNVEQINEFSWIYTGDSNAFAENLKKAGKGVTLLIVGHMPTLGDWGYLLSGERILFEKGGMACFTLTDGAPLHARLAWLSRASGQIHPGQAAEGAGLITPAGSIKQMKGMLETIQESERRFLHKPGDAENAHQLRVSLRQARSLMSLMKPAVKDDGFGESREALKAIADRLAYVRELDVLKGQLRSRAMKGGKGSGFKKIKKAVKSERKMEQSALFQYFSGGAHSGAMREIVSRIDGLDGAEREPGQFDGQVRRQFEKWNRNAADALVGLDVHNHPQAHSLRITLKKLHNAQGFFPSLTVWDWAGHEERKSLENLLGKLCDTWASEAILKKIRTAYAAKGLKKEIEALTGQMRQRRKKMEGRLVSLRSGKKPMPETMAGN